MTIKLLVISGGLACGKSTLADRLADEFGCHIHRTSELIRQLDPSVQQDRASLQIAGNKLDRTTRHTWIALALAQAIRQNNRHDIPIILDGVRKRKQLEAIQKAIGHRHVRHVHLRADRDTQQNRYNNRAQEKDKHFPFDRAIEDASERQLHRLAPLADVVIDTERYTKSDVYHHVVARLGFQSRTADRLVDVVIGGQYGSEGKGNIADYLGNYIPKCQLPTGSQPTENPV